MKLKLFLTMVIFMTGIYGYTRILAQPGNESKEHKSEAFNKHQDGLFGFQILNLTEEQKLKVKALRLEHFKEIQPLRNHLDELKAKEHTLITLEKPDISTINSNIDEITKTQNQMMKLRARHHQQVSELLTDEQRVYFDMKFEHMRNHFQGQNFQYNNEAMHGHGTEHDNK